VIASFSAPVAFVGSLLVGFVTGLLSGMFGIGGAVVSTPALRAFGASPLEAVGSTLPSIFPSSITGTLRYQREGLVRWDVLRWTAAFGVAASVGGSLLSDVFPGGGHVLMLLTAALIAWTAYRTAKPALTRARVVPAVAPPTTAAVPDVDAPVAGLDEPVADLDAPVADLDAPVVARTEPWRLAIVGVGAGGLSGLLGVGGGILMVPAFSTWVRLPLKETIATSLAIVGILAVPGTITHAILGHIVWSYAIPLSIGVIPGARIGAHLTISASDRTVRLAVGFMLGALSIVYAVREVLAL
jgi:uncharacterized membrane protein YfcA